VVAVWPNLQNLPEFRLLKCAWCHSNCSVGEVPRQDLEVILVQRHREQLLSDAPEGVI
jgi:hypothetical protein